jgi:hypothetical protein
MKDKVTVKKAIHGWFIPGKRRNYFSWPIQDSGIIIRKVPGREYLDR